jgi:hypothetical protein
MELTETIESINRQLIDLYGIDTVSGKPIWRIVWSEDQYEKRLVNVVDSGLFLTEPIVREVPKYRHYIREKYILEYLSIIPEFQKSDLPSTKVSYEPIWTFVDAQGNYLPPKLEAAKFIIDAINAARGKKSMAKYKEEGIDNPIEMQQQRVAQIEAELFGNETAITDALAHGQGIVVPNKES